MIGKPIVRLSQAGTFPLLCLALITLPPALSLVFAEPNTNDASKAAAARDADGDDGNWGEPLLGVRMRLTAPRGNEYRRGKRLPLTVEMQNITDQPIPYPDLAPYCDFKVFTKDGDWLGIARRAVSISPWEGADGALSPKQVLRWHVWFDRMRLNKPVPAGVTVQLRVGVPRQIIESGKLPRTNYSKPVSLKMVDAPPIDLREDNNPRQLTQEDVTGRWREEMDVVYREAGGLFLRSLAIHVDGHGNVTMLNCGGVKGRSTTRFNRDRLDELATRLREMKIWELSDVKWRLTNPDEGEVRIALTYGGSAIVGDFANGTVHDNKTLSAFKAEMLSLIDEAVEAALVEKDAEGKRTGSTPPRPSEVPASYLTSPEPSKEQRALGAQANSVKRTARDGHDSIVGKWQIIKALSNDARAEVEPQMHAIEFLRGGTFRSWCRISEGDEMSVGSYVVKSRDANSLEIAIRMQATQVHPKRFTLTAVKRGNFEGRDDQGGTKLFKDVLTFIDHNGRQRGYQLDR